MKGEIRVMFDELNIEITQNEIIKSIKQLKNSKTGGPDLYINELFINGMDTLIPYFHNIFNAVLNSGYFPKSWTDGHIVPIHKKGSVEMVENYRRITLLSTLGKLFTRILNNRLITWAEKYNVYIEAQSGFRRNMGTTDNIFILHGLINHHINTNQKLFCAFVDFTKAFDYVVRDIIWYKLIKFGVRGKILDIIRSMYSNVKSRVKY